MRMFLFGFKIATKTETGWKYRNVFLREMVTTFMRWLIVSDCKILLSNVME